MADTPRDMTFRLVPIDSPEASESRVAGSAADRIRLVAILSAMMWTRTRRPLPVYSRATMPVRFVSQTSVRTGE